MHGSVATTCQWLQEVRLLPVTKVLLQHLLTCRTAVDRSSSCYFGNVLAGHVGMSTSKTQAVLCCCLSKGVGQQSTREAKQQAL
jgi:hypothetical protein